MVINQTKQTVVATRMELARTARARRVGLLKYERLEPGHALGIRARKGIPFIAIHTFGMKFPIDVLFLDKHNKVIRCFTMPPNRIAWARGARMVLETSAGAIDHSRTHEGDAIKFQESSFPEENDV